MSDLTPEQAEALKIAGEMIDAGIPVFAAAPDPDRPGQYYLPKEWEKTVPSRMWLEKWRPGWALGAVGGHVADFLDFDPRNGGNESRKELEIQGDMPRSFGTQLTPSGGKHEVISLTGERKATDFMPGVDLQSGGEADSHGKHGRGFVYIAPTVRPSKAPETLGELREYRWETPPDLEYLKEFGRGQDGTLDGVIARVHAKRSRKPERSAFQQAEGGSQLFTSNPRTPFTLESAQAFCIPHLEVLEQAQVGGIEDAANNVATVLSHFVPAFWSADEAMAVLKVALSKTAYDPTRRESTWTADKFMPVLDGTRPPADNWKAERRYESVAAVPEPTGDEVDALIAEMLTADQLQERPAPKYLIKGLLNLDSEAWTIGEPGCKKSFVVLDQAIHVVKGMPWRGLKVSQGPVVMIAAEGAAGMSTRVKAWQQEYGPIGAGFHMLPRPVQANDYKAWRVLAEACRRLGAVMVVIDTQARVTVGLKENDATDMGVYVHAVGVIREATGACVHTIHHTGRNGGDARGSSAIDGAQGTELKVVKKSAYAGVLTVEKQKDMEEISDIPLAFKRVVVGQDSDGDDISSLVLIEGSVFRDAEGQEHPEQWQVEGMSVREMVLRVLADHGEDRGLTKPEARATVIDRFYGGQKARLENATWHTAWNRAVKHDSVVGTGGGRFTVDPLAEEEMS